MSNLKMDFRQPPARLADHFSFFYHFQQDDDRFEGVDRADYAQFRFILRGRNARYRFVDGTEQAMPDIYILGPTTGCSSLSCDGAAEAIGVGLMPHGWAALVPMDASAAANRLFDAKDLFGPIVTEVYEKLRATPEFDARVAILEEMLVTLMTRQKPGYQAFVGQVNAWLAGATAPEIDDLVALTGLSLRQVQRGCKRYFGSPPKVLARKYRALRAAVALVSESQTVDDLIARGFYDQSHLIREIKQFTGHTPRQIKAEPSLLSQLTITQRVALGGQVSPLISDT